MQCLKGLKPFALSLLFLSFFICVPAYARNPTTEASPQKIYAAAWQVVRDRYVDSTFGGQDWSHWEHRFDDKMRSPEDAYAAINTMLESLHDPYTRIQTRRPESLPIYNASPVPSVTYKELDGDVGYIKVSSLATLNCAREFASCLKSLRKASSIIIDLRGNQGGFVVNALEMADMLLPEAPIVTTISRVESKTYTSGGCPISRQPIVILVDEQTASASEIFIGAMHDNHRATIVGSKTFGKGLVQDEQSLPGGAVIKVSTAHYFTPAGFDVHKHGFTPDIVIDNESQTVETATRFLNTQASGEG